MAGIEVRAFGKLHFLFQERGWPIPLVYEPEGTITAAELCAKLQVPAEDVEAVFVNRQIVPKSTLLHDGDRVAFVPPGVPSIHRFNLGFYASKENG
ncbi:MAG TPA: MoaD/ThiS family protein [Candidatus Limnocylindrales bacterium]|nr:MoaD/ThiS family protein [Candidatus Limnocylindrales bacterium]